MRTVRSASAVYAYEDIREVHLEITSRCNAACPQCPRNLAGGATNPGLPLTELSLDDVRKIFPEGFVRQLRKVYLCGNYGDAMVAGSTLPALEYMRAASPSLVLGIHTNGSGRTAAWWGALARVVSYCRFGIDGLEDTNHLYRRGTSWSRVMDAARAFIAAGGVAEWDFIVFEHNQHQVEEARALARQMGFARFFAKRTSRFWAGGEQVERASVRDRRGDVVYTIAAPTDPAFRNTAATAITAAISGKDAYRRYLATCAVKCRVQEPAKLYVSAEGLVLPCCFLANLYPPGRAPGTAPIFALLERLGGKDAIDARLQGVRDIVEGPLFQRLVPAGWAPGDARLEPCARVCGEYDLHARQYGASLL